MVPPYTPEVEVDGRMYFPAPYSVDPLPPTIQRGLIPIGTLALFSVGSTLCLISFICYRFITWRMHYRTFIGYNQYVVLVLNLLLADLQQALGFLISFHWIRKGSMLAPSSTCFAQGWLIHSGDVASGCFVFAIAVHTLLTTAFAKRLGNAAFTASIVSLWVFAYTLTGIGVGIHGHKYFVNAGAWCWVSPAFENDRLALHYVWIFFIEFSTILIYVFIFFVLRRQTRQLMARQYMIESAGPSMTTIAAINRIARLMTIYPCVYLLLTLPLSVGRMWSMAHGGRATSDAFACTAGALLTSCGWVDSLLYTLTRRRLLNDTMPGSGSSSDRPSRFNIDATEMADKDVICSPSPTLAAVGSMDTLRSAGPSTRVDFTPGYLERTNSQTGSTDRILGARPPVLGAKPSLSVFPCETPRTAVWDRGMNSVRSLPHPRAGLNGARF